MTAADLFNAIFNAAFSLGQIMEPARRVRLLVGTLVVNSVLGPLVAIGICYLLPLTDRARVGVTSSEPTTPAGEPAGPSGQTS